MHRLSRAAGAVCLLALAVAAEPAQGQELGGTAPDSFNVDIAATPLLIEMSAPAALPLDVLAGIAYSQVGINSQPRVQSTAGPAFIPLASDVGLLGGPAGVLATVVRLAPGLVVGIPSLFGLDPLPVDPSLVDVNPVATLVSGLPIPNAPPLGCTSYYPDVPREASCGGPVQDFFGFRFGGGSARTVSTGEEDDPSSLASRSDASVVGLAPANDSSLTPFRAGAAASTAESKVVEGRITAAASAEVGEIDVAGGLTISDVKASYAAAMGGTAETFDQTPLTCEIGAVQLAGERIALDQAGITLGDQQVPSPLDPVVGELGSAIGSQGGQVGDADFGSVTITPNPQPTSEVSADGTQVTHRFGCLEIRYRNATSGTDITLTLGNLSVTMSAFLDTPFAEADGLGSEAVLDDTGTSESAGSDSLGEMALPDVPDAGSNAPAPASNAFLEASDQVLSAGWGIDGAWFAPFGLLALSLPVLTRSRRFAPSLPHHLRRR